MNFVRTVNQAITLTDLNFENLMEHHSGHHIAMEDASILGHEGHDMPEMPEMCSMKMTFNTDLVGMCVIFEWWHIQSVLQLALSCLVIVALSVFYEKLRQISRNYDQRLLIEDKKRDTPLLGNDSNDHVITSTYMYSFLSL